MKHNEKIKGSGGCSEHTVGQLHLELEVASGLQISEVLTRVNSHF